MSDTHIKGTILYVGGFELPDRSAAANRVVSNGKIFATLGYRVAYLGVASDEERFEGVRPVSWSKDVFEEAHPSTSVQWMTHLFSTKHLEMVASRYPDLCMIVLYNVPFCTLTRVKGWCRKRHIRVVYDCTEWSADTDGSTLKRWFKKVDERYVRKKIGRVADGLIVISTCMERQYAPHTKWLLRLPPLVDVGDPIWHQPALRREGRFEFCFAGGLDGNKESLDRIVEAFVALQDPQAYLRIIGVTQEKFNVHYPHMAGVQNERIFFMGRLSHAETIQYALSCDCYIFVREADRRNSAGFPTKFAEAFTCGVPILTTDVSDVAGYVRAHDRGEILDSLDVTCIRQAMQRRLDAVGKPGALDEAFHYETYVAQTDQWLKGLCNGE